MQKEESPAKKTKVEIVIPRRKPSVVIPGRKIVYPSPDKTTCAECPCYPKESPYRKPVKLRACLTTPLTLYELTAVLVDELKFPEAFHWSVEDVAEWMAHEIGLPEYKVFKQWKPVNIVRKLRAYLTSPPTLYELTAVLVEAKFPEAFHWSVEDVAEWTAQEVGLPEYKEPIIDNKINGRRLLMLEGPSHLPPIGVHSLDHIKRITSKVRELFSTEFIRFSRSIGLPTRYPLTHCTWFKSRTGPSWGIRRNWTRCDVLRAMGIIMPEPKHLDHWDLVWYHKPDFPKVKFARIPKRYRVDDIPHFTGIEECNEIQVPRKFILEKHIPSEFQLIWMQKIHYPPLFPEKKVKKKPKKPSRLVPKPVKLEGLKGQQLLLARRKMNKPKFLP